MTTDGIWNLDLLYIRILDFVVWRHGLQNVIDFHQRKLESLQASCELDDSDALRADIAEELEVLQYLRAKEHV